MSGYRIIFVGAPGSGKGTQAQRLLERYSAQQISTGDILRQARKDGTALGKEAQKYMDDGKLVPDELIINLIKDTLGEGKFSSGWVLDGFPRTLAQAEALDAMLVVRHLELDRVVSIEVDDEDIVTRIGGRFSCARCGALYHDVFSRPKKDGTCDVCGATDFVRRPDDTAETVRKRLQAYHGQTAPIIEHYRKQGLVHCVDGSGAIDEVTERLTAAIREGTRVD